MVDGARTPGLEDDAGLLHKFVEREAARSFFAGAERGADGRPIGRIFPDFGRLAVARWAAGEAKERNSTNEAFLLANPAAAVSLTTHTSLSYKAPPLDRAAQGKLNQAPVKITFLILTVAIPMVA